jgi:hypothetical protein
MCCAGGEPGNDLGSTNVSCSLHNAQELGFAICGFRKDCGFRFKKGLSDAIPAKGDCIRTPSG